MFSFILHSIAFVYLLSGSISDMKIREVADWSNYGLIVFGLMINLIFSVTTSDYNYILNSVFGFIVFLAIALVMYYTGQWGGGDSKLLMGLGALYGLGLRWENNEFLVFFLVNTLLAGAVYGIIWSFAKAVQNRKEFVKAYTKILKNKYVAKTRKILWIILPVAVLVAIFFINQFSIMLLGMYVAVYVTFYLWMIVKSVEESCMKKLVEPNVLTEGDWLAKQVKVGRKVIVPETNLGVSKKQISLLKRLYKQKKIRKVVLKEGIPFVPSFFLGWIVTLLFGNLFLLFI